LFNLTTLTITLTGVPSPTTQFTITNIRNYDVTSSPVSLNVSVFSSVNFAM
jgi:hypothetical protein